jgi:O-antigen/teichoic acid export membrane protein
LNLNYSGRSIAKYTVYNLLGYGIPLLFAIVLIPPLLKGLGEEKFGILNLVWMIIGYFGFFDFGIGRALTKTIAEKIGNSQLDEIPGIFWTSLFSMLIVSLIGAGFIVLFAPVLVYKFFNISETFRPETLDTFYLLALSIPIVTTTAGIKGFLEAYQRFGIINIVRVTLGIFSFLIPLLCLIFTSSLVWIVLCLMMVRLVVWSIYLAECFKANTNLRSAIYLKASLVKRVLKLSGWMTISNIIVPVFVNLDRFLIGVLVSATAITFYAIPYEVISKLLIFPGAIAGVLFPAFSASHLNDPSFTKKILLKAVKYIFLLFFPIVLVIITFANEGLDLWLGENYAIQSTLVLQLLAVGVIFISLAYIPYSFLEGIGRPDITAKIQLIELPIYILAMWFGIKKMGINGAALIWMLRVILDAVILFFLAKKYFLTDIEFKFKPNYLFLFFLISLSFIPIISDNIILKFIFIPIVMIIFVYTSWKFILVEEEKSFFLSKLKIPYL